MLVSYTRFAANLKAMVFLILILYLRRKVECTPLELEKDISYSQATGKEDAA
jgi:hypothetical protein